MIVERMNRSIAAAVGLSEAKEHARVDGDFEDLAISRMIDSATREAEELAQIALLHQTIRVTLDSWPRGSSVALPIAPLLDWSTVQISASGEAFEDFSVITGLRPMVRTAGFRPSGGVVIEYQAGFGADGGALPEDLRQAVLDQVAAYYDARGSGDPRVQALSPHFVRIVGRYRRVRA